MTEWNVQVLLGRPWRRHFQLYQFGAGSLVPEAVGDCFRACLASLLDVEDLDDVPHLAHQRDVDEYHAGLELPWHDLRLAREWLRAVHDLDLAPIDRGHADQLGVPYIAKVHSRRGPWHHAVIAQDGIVAFDPSGIGSGSPYELPADAADDAALVLCLPFDPDPPAHLTAWFADAAAAGDVDPAAAGILGGRR